MLSRIVSYISRSLFLYGLTRLRRGSTFLSATHTVIAIAVAMSNPIYALILVVPLIILYYWSSMPKQLGYAAIVAVLPASWMALTHLAVTWARGLPDYTGALWVLLRAETGSLHALYLLHSINTGELASIVYKLAGSKDVALIPHLVWRTVSLMLRESSEMLHLHKLKEEKTWRTLAMVIVRGDEISKLLNEGAYLKRYSFMPRTLYNRNTIYAQLLLVMLDMMVAIAAWHAGRL